MKLVWSPDTALKAYINTVKSCESENYKGTGVPELLSAMAAGWNAKVIVESWSYGNPITTSIGLAVAAKQTCGRHVCLVPDERSRLEYLKAMKGASMGEDTEVVVVGAVEDVMAVAGVDFMVVDSKRREFVSVLRFARLSNKGAVLVRKNAYQSCYCGFRWHGLLDRGTRVVKSLYLPVGNGLDIAHIGAGSGGGGGGGGGNLKRNSNNNSRWITCVDQKSGEQHLFRY